MIKKLFLASLIFLAVDFYAAGKKEVKPKVKEIPLKEFLSESEMSYFTISGNGKYVAYVAPYKKRSNIFYKNLETGETKRLTSDSKEGVGAFNIIGNNILYVKDKGGDENYSLYSIDLETLEESNLTPFEDVKVMGVKKTDNEDEIIVVMNKDDKSKFFLYNVNIKTKEVNLIFDNPIEDYILDDNNQVIALQSLDEDGLHKTVKYRASAEEEFQDIKNYSFLDTFAFLKFDPKTKNIIMSSSLNRDKAAIVSYNPKTDKEEVLYQNDTYDVYGIKYSSKDKKILSYVFEGDRGPEEVYADNNYKKTHEFLKKEFPNKNVSIISKDKDEKRMVLRVYSDVMPPVYYLFDKDTGQIDELGKSKPNLKEEDLAFTKPMTYQSRDGLTIHSYLTLPRGLEKAKKLPLVLFIHGGPWERDYWGYNGYNRFVQILANRGYAVFQPNFRGSTGYGKEFVSKSFKQWGLKMDDDLVDGVNYLIKKGIVDKKNVNVFGASYGGYATLMTIINNPEMYKTAVDLVGPSNIISFINSFPPYWKPFLEQVKIQVGDFEKDKEALKKVSPLFNLDKIKTPLFVAQGANDPRVNRAESDNLVKKLKENGVDVIYMLKEDEGHGFYKEENLIEFFEKMLDFIK